jgi:hypothetical protein
MKDFQVELLIFADYLNGGVSLKERCGKPLVSLKGSQDAKTAVCSIPSDTRSGGIDAETKNACKCPKLSHCSAPIPPSDQVLSSKPSLRAATTVVAAERSRHDHQSRWAPECAV